MPSAIGNADDGDGEQGLFVDSFVALLVEAEDAKATREVSGQNREGEVAEAAVVLGGDKDHLSVGREEPQEAEEGVGAEGPVGLRVLRRALVDHGGDPPRVDPGEELPEGVVEERQRGA